MKAQDIAASKSTVKPTGKTPAKAPTRPVAAPSPMSLSLGMPVDFGDFKGVIFGGPFRQYVPGTRRLIGIKMAAEISHPHDFAVDTRDFSVPSHEAMQEGILFALVALTGGNDVYVGCMGGIGRTGLFMGCMAKVLIAWGDQHEAEYDHSTDPVKYVRAHYHPAGGHVAIETQSQKDFIEDFSVGPALEFLTGFTAPQVVEKEVIVEKPIRVEVPGPTVYLGPVEWAMHQFKTWFK